METNYFESALKNYIDSRKAERCFYCDTNIVNYKTLFDFIITDAVLCNNITNIDYDFIYNVESAQHALEEEEEEEPEECYQYFIVNVDSWRLEQYNKYCIENKKESCLILYYSNILECYILGVNHFGTSWDYVPTNIKIEGLENES